MDLSALIFVALAGAWVVYLVPKALSAQEEDEETRSVDSFSDSMRILARREAGATGESELVVTGRTPSAEKPPVVEKSPAAEKPPVAEPEKTPAVETPAAERAETLTPVQRQLRRAAAARAAKRRRRVLGLILLGVLGTVVAAGLGHIAWFYVAAPTVLLVAWLAACRLMVRQEHASRAAQRSERERRTAAAEAAAEDEAAADDGPVTEDIPVVRVGDGEEKQGWDPVPITLPTYVEKASAGRTVRTIDLDSTGVWSSGRNEADSLLAREAEQSQQADRAEGSSDRRRATGS